MFEQSEWEGDLLSDRLFRNGRTSELVGKDRNAAVRALKAFSSSFSKSPCCVRASLNAKGMMLENGRYSSIPR